MQKMLKFNITVIYFLAVGTWAGTLGPFQTIDILWCRFSFGDYSQTFYFLEQLDLIFYLI